jgi:hypothetical protein
MDPYAGVDYNLTLCALQSRLQHIYHVQPYARVDLKGTVRPDWICMRVVSLDSPLKEHQMLYVFKF